MNNKKEQNRMIVAREKCHICGQVSDFNISDKATLLRDAICMNCGASLRTSDLAGVILREIECKYDSLEEGDGDLPLKKILNVSSCGFIHEYLKYYPGYVASEYFNSVKSGGYKDGVLCVDLCNIPFPDNSFDLIISEDVLEHVENYQVALSEIWRVLRRGGKHIFTVPLHENKQTISRKGNANYVYHGDPIRPEKGCLVYTDFGNDILGILSEARFESKLVIGHKFYEKDAITDVDKSYEAYLEKKSNLEEYFQYNSNVIVAAKEANAYQREMMQIDSSGVRFIPELHDEELEIEHLQRYYSIKEIVRNKRVLDAACGEGYGSAIIAETALNVQGIDIDPNAIGNAKKKYEGIKNLSFVTCSISHMPMIESKSKDVVISFETIEHVKKDVQIAFMNEICRILTSDGILVMSTPEKMEYTDRFNFHNPFHVEEFYEKDFFDFLSSKFKNISAYYQFLEVGSFVVPALRKQNGMVKYFENITNSIHKPKYLIVIATNGDLPTDVMSSVFLHEREEYYSLKDQISKQKMKADSEKNKNKLLKEELDRRAVELENRMTLINSLNHKIQENENTIKLQKEELDRRAVELENRMLLINSLNQKILECTENE